MYSPTSTGTSNLSRRSINCKEDQQEFSTSGAS